VRKVRVNSIPEKMPRNRKCTLRKVANMSVRCSTVAVTNDKSPAKSEEGPSAVTLALSFAAMCILVPRVSGRATTRNSVSITSRIKVIIAGAA
jgi:hypothetical protein